MWLPHFRLAFRTRPRKEAEFDGEHLMPLLRRERLVERKLFAGENDKHSFYSTKIQLPGGKSFSYRVTHHLQILRGDAWVLVRRCIINVVGIVILTGKGKESRRRSSISKFQRKGDCTPPWGHPRLTFLLRLCSLIRKHACLLDKKLYMI